MKKIYGMTIIFFIAFFLAACAAEHDGTAGLEFEEIQAGYVVSGYHGEAAEVTIPEQYRGQQVIGIQTGAFVDNGTITQVNAASSVNYIESGAFAENPELSRVVLPKSVETIRKDAFLNNEKLTLYCEVSGKPEGWSYRWKSSDNDVVWNSARGEIQVWRNLADVQVIPENNRFQAEGIYVSSDYTARTGMKDYTVLYYINGRDDLGYLYGQELDNLVRIMAENPELSQSVNIVVEVAAGGSFESDNLQGETNYRFTVDGNGIRDLQDLGKRNAGDANAMSDFINFGKASYPAKHTFLIMSGSGNGLENIYWTDNAYNSETGDDDGNLTMTEVREALSGSAASEEKLALLLMKTDGCASAEWAYQMEPYAYVMIATPGRVEKVPASQNWLSLLETGKAPQIYQGICGELTDELIADSSYAPFGQVILGKLKTQLEHWNQKLVSMNQEELQQSMEQIGRLRQDRENYYDSHYTSSPISMKLNALSQNAFPDFAAELAPGDTANLSVFMPQSSYDGKEMKDYEAFNKMEGYNRYVKALKQYGENGTITSLDEIKLAAPKQTGTYLNYDMTNIQALYEVQFMRDDQHKDILYACGYDNSGKVGVDGQVLEQLSVSTFQLQDSLLCAMEQSASDAYLHLYQIPVLVNGKFDLLLVESGEEDRIAGLKVRGDALSGEDIITPLYPVITTRSSEDEIFEGDAYYDGKYKKGKSFRLTGLQQGETVRLARTRYKNSQRLFLLIDEEGRQEFSFAG